MPVRIHDLSDGGRGESGPTGKNEERIALVRGYEGVGNLKGESAPGEPESGSPGGAGACINFQLPQELGNMH